ncbi:DUF6113 family protein [Actinomadura craniellae]|uniref:DUF6113 family protein n=1 Tax=Actinomadura craniellae TaxID=2231787 RepID=UPI001F35E2F9|nr:DUF6113 family protein [Actinomadura craniellae]
MLAILTGLAYGALAALGVVLGLVGSFTHAWLLGGVPVVLLVLLAVNLAGTWLAGWAMGGRLGGIVPAAAWTLVAVLMSTRRPEGDLIISGTLLGYGFLLGGMVTAAVAIMLIPSASTPWLLRGAPGAPAVGP